MSRMSGCWPRWDDIPVPVKNAICADLMVIKYKFLFDLNVNRMFIIQVNFNMQAAVRVEPQDLNVFRNHWNQRMRKNYRNTLTKVKSAGKKPSWMSADIYSEFLRLWDTAEFKVSYPLSNCNLNFLRFRILIALI